jgi:ABC-type multidrug transport system ATPase subunit
MPEFLQLYANMRVKDVLKFLAELKGYNNCDIDKILDIVFLLDHSNKKIRDLSKGMKQRLNLAQAIIGNPKIMLFDEPSNGFDCSSINMFYSILRKMADNGSVILISSHHLTEVYGNVDKVLILSNGFIIKELDINLSNFDENFFFKEVSIFLDNVIDYSSMILLKNRFNGININNSYIFYAKVNSKIIIDLIIFIFDLNYSIKDIRIENKILEGMLTELS